MMNKEEVVEALRVMGVPESAYAALKYNARRELLRTERDQVEVLLKEAGLKDADKLSEAELMEARARMLGIDVIEGGADSAVIETVESPVVLDVVEEVEEEPDREDVVNTVVDGAIDSADAEIVDAVLVLEDGLIPMRAVFGFKGVPPGQIVREDGRLQSGREVRIKARESFAADEQSAAWAESSRVARRIAS